MCTICHRYQEGASIRALAKRERLSPMTIAEHLRRYGVPVRPRGRPRRNDERGE